MRSRVPSKPLFRTGDRVALKALTSDTSLNGAVGTVAGYDKRRARFFVDLDLQRGREVNVRAQHLRLLPSSEGLLQDVTFPKGILEPTVTKSVGVVVQDVDCTSIDMDGGLREVTAVFPFAAPFKSRVAARAEGVAQPFATAETSALPGTAVVISPPDDEDSVMDSPRAGEALSSVAFLNIRWGRGAACDTPTCPLGPKDTEEARLGWFKDSLEGLERALPAGVESVAVPWRIGCRKNKEAWKAYRQELAWFAKRNPQLQVFVVRKSSESISNLEEQTAKRRGRVHRATEKARALAQEETEPFQCVLANALVDELESTAVGREDAPKFAAAILYATCAARNITPPAAEESDLATAAAAWGESKAVGMEKEHDEGGFEKLRSLARAALVRDATAGVQQDSVLGSVSVRALEKEVAAVAEQAEAARAAVKVEREWIDDRFREHCRERFLREGLPENVAAAYSAAALLTPQALRLHEIVKRQEKVHLRAEKPRIGREDMRKEGIDVGSHLEKHVPTRLLGLQVSRAADGATATIVANIADSGAMTVILGLSDYERMERELPGSMTRLKYPKSTSFGGVQGVTGSSPALFHVAFTLDFDGVPIRIHDAPVLAGHSGLLLGVDVLGAGRSSLNFDKGKSFKGSDGSDLPCDGFMSLRDSAEQVVATLPLVHRRTTLDGIAKRAPVAQTFSASAAMDEAISEAVEAAVPIAYAPEAVRVPAWSEHMMRVRAPAAAVGDYDLAVLPLEDDRIHDIGVMVAPCLQRPDKDGYMWIRVINPSMQPVHIGGLTPMARFIVNPEVRGAGIQFSVDEVMAKVNLDPEHKERARWLIRQMLSKRLRLFSDTLQGYAQGTKQVIKTVGISEGREEPPNEQCRRLSPDEYAALKAEVDKQLKQRIIMPIVSPFSAAPMLIAKPPLPDGTPQYRVVLDFRRLNAMTEKDTYPLPRVDENLAKLGKAKFFTTIDLLMGFHQVELEESSIPKTAFSTPWGQFAYTRMPMGLTSSPSAFMRVVDATLRGLPPNIALAYCDDVIIYTDGDLEQHMVDVGKVFDKLIEGGFTVKCSKVHIGKSEVPYLGFMVGRYGTRPIESKVEPIRNMTVAAMQKDPKVASRFAGMIGVYQKFIDKCQNILAPFHELKAKKSDARAITTSLRFIASFAYLQGFLCNLTALARPDLSKPFYVDVDGAALGGAGLALSQRENEDDPDSHRPLAFASARFSDAERGWPVRDQECYALFLALKEWRHWLLGARVIIRTDHRSLQHLKKMRLRNGERVSEWGMQLCEFDADVEWVPGTRNLVADCLSRDGLPVSDPPVVSLEGPSGPAPSSRGEGEKTRGGDGMTGAKAQAQVAFAELGEEAVFSEGPYTAIIFSTVGHQAASRSAEEEREEAGLKVGPLALVRKAQRASAVFLRRKPGGLQVWIERDRDGYRFPSVGIDGSRATYKEQLAASFIDQYGADNTLARMLSRSKRLRGAIGNTEAVAFVVLCNDSYEGPAPRLCEGAGFMDLSPETAELLAEEVDWSAAVVICRELLWERLTARTRNMWRTSCLKTMRKSLQAEEASVAAAEEVELLLPSIEEAPEGPAFIVSDEHAAEAARLLWGRLRGSKNPRIAVDLEGALGGSKGAEESREIDLIQVAVKGEAAGEKQLVYVFDLFTNKGILRDRGSDSLRAILEDGNVCKIIHCCYGDSASLWECYGIVMHNVRDSAIADSILRGQSANLQRGLEKILLDRLGSEVVHLTFKGTLEHEYGLFQKRPLPLREFIYAYEDVVYLVPLHDELEELLKEKGLLRLWTQLSLQRCPPNPQVPRRVVVALVGKRGGILCLRQRSSSEHFLPSGTLTADQLKGHPLKSRAAAIWREAMGISGKLKAGMQLALESRLRKPILLGDTYVVMGQVESCVAACDEITAAQATAEGIEPAVYAFGQSAKSGALIRAEDKVSFEYLECEEGRKLPPSPALCERGSGNSAEGYVVTGPVVSKVRAAMLLHDGESVVTLVSPTKGGQETFPETPIDLKGTGEDSALRALTTFLGVVLVKGGDSGNNLVMPQFTGMVNRAVDNMQLVCKYGNTEYYSCYVERAVGPGGSAPEPAFRNYAASLYAARTHHMAYRNTDTQRKEAKGISIRRIKGAGEHMMPSGASTSFEAVALEVLQEKLDSGEITVKRHTQGSEAQAYVGHGSQHSEPLLPPVGDDDEFDRLFEAAFVMKFAAACAAGGREEAVAAVLQEGLAAMPADKLPSMVDLRKAQREHPASRKIIDYLELGDLSFVFQDMSEAEQENFREACSRFCVTRDGLLTVNSDATYEQARLWVPPCFHKQICRAFHDRLGHHGVTKTVNLISERFAWGENATEMRDFVRKYIGKCAICKRAKVPHHQVGEGHIMATGNHPFDILGTDVYKTGLSADEYDSVVTFVCYFTRHVTAAATKGDPTSEEIVRLLLNEVIKHYGVPSEVRSDHASVFVSRAIKVLYAKYGIKISASTAYHHRTVGLVERWHSCLKAILLCDRLSSGPGKADKWHESLPLVTMAFNATINATTGHSPFFAAHGRHCRLPFDSLMSGEPSSEARDIPAWVEEHLARLEVVYDAVSKNLKLNALHRKKLFDLKRDTQYHFKAGDSVLLLKGSYVDGNLSKKEHATEGPYDGPFTVSARLPNGNYRLKDMKTRRVHDEVHVERLQIHPKGQSTDDVERYPVKCINGRRVVKLTSADRDQKLPKGTTQLQYRVRWQGHPDFADTWRSVEYLGRVKELTDAYDARIGVNNEGPRVHNRDAAIDLEGTGDDKPVGRRFFRGRPESSNAAGEEQTKFVDDSEVVPKEPVEEQIDTSDSFPAGSRVEVRYGDGTWWKGTVQRTFVSRTKQPERMIIVKYDDERWTKLYQHGLRGSPVRLAKEKVSKPIQQQRTKDFRHVAEERRLKRMERLKKQLL